MISPDLKEKLTADHDAECPAELRRRAREIRREGLLAQEIVRQLASIEYRLRDGQDTSTIGSPENFAWDEAIASLADIESQMHDLADECMTRANELDEQADDAGLTEGQRKIARAEG